MLRCRCPGALVLTRLMLGEGEEPEIRLFEEHLERCDACLAALERLKVEGPLLEALATSGRALAGAPSDAVLGPLVERLFRLAEAAPAEGPGEWGQSTAEADGPPALARYEVLGELGRGGMSIVFRARQVGLNRLVALKMLLGGSQARPEQRARFRAEAEAVARLQHPHVVQIFEVGEHRGLPFCVLELVEGGSLADKLAGALVPAAEAARLTALLARATQAAHQAGIVHRDLKPANVLLVPSAGPLAVPLGGPSGQSYEPKITDFGLARRLDVETGHSLSGDVMGTPSYMAPEQAGGLVREVGPAADVWALGAILYEMLTGRPPFRGVTVLDTLEQVRSAEPVPPRRLQPGVPRDLETICLQCLQKEPGRRYASAAGLAEDLRRFQDHEPIRARPPGPGRRAVKWARRHPAGGVALVASVLLGLGLVAGLLGHTARLDRERLAAQNSAADAERQRRAAERSAAEAHSQRNEADLRLAYQLLQSGDVFGLDDLLDRHRLESGAEPRGFAWRYLQGQRRGPRREVRAHDGAPALLAFGVDGKTLLTAGNRGATPAAKVWGLAAGRQLWATPVAPAAPEAAVAALSADGQTLAVCCWPDVVAILDVNGRREKARLTFPQPRALALSPDGRRLAVAGAGQALIWDVARRRQTCRFDPGGEAFVQFAFSPDGQRLALLSLGYLRAWPLEGGQVRPPLRREMWAPAPSSFAWSPSGQLLAVVDVDGLQFLDAARLARRGRWPLPRQGLTTAAFSPDGRALALGGGDGCLLWWDVQQRQALGLYRWQGQPVCRLAFSPDGRSLAAATADGRVSWMAASPPGRFERLQPALALGPALAFSPDGKALAVAGARRGAVLLSPAGLRPRARLAPAPQRIAQVAFISEQGLGRPLLLTVGAADGALALWNNSGKLERHLTCPGAGEPSCLAVSSDGKQAAVGLSSGRVVLWGLPAETYRYLEHGARVTCLAFSPDGRALAAGGEDRTVKFWELPVKAKMPAPAEQLTLDAPVLAVAFSPDGRHFLASSDGRGVRAWKRDRGQWRADQAPLPLGHHTAHHLLWSADGQSLLGIGADGRAHCWNFPARALTWERRHPFGPTVVKAAAWSADGTRLALGLAGGLVEAWHLPSWRVQRAAEQGLAGPVSSVAFTPDGRHLITASALAPRQVRETALAVPWLGVRAVADRCLPARTTDAGRAWDVATGTEQGPPLPEQFALAPPTLVVPAPDGSVLACAAEDGGVTVVERRSRSVRAKLFASERARAYSSWLELVPGAPVIPAYPEGARALAFSRSGRWLAVLGTRGQVRVWETGSWQEHWTMPNARGAVTWLAFDPDDRLVTSQEGGLHWWDVSERELRRKLGGAAADVLCGAFAPGGRLLATGTADGRIQLRDVEAGKATSLPGHHDRVTALAFAPDGGTLASASRDGSVRLWTAAGREIAALEGPRGRMWSLAFSPDGMTLAAGGEGPEGTGDVVLWRAGR